MLLRHWSVVDPYDRGEYLILGDVYGDPHRPPGRNVYTSTVVGLRGRTVTTVTGSTYRLAWCWGWRRKVAILRANLRG